MLGIRNTVPRLVTEAPHLGPGRKTELMTILKSRIGEHPFENPAALIVDHDEVGASRGHLREGPWRAQII